MTISEAAEKYLKDQINKSGKPLEIRVSSFLDEKWKHVSNQDTYVDQDEKKLKEIDICAFDGPKRVGNIELEATLVIECKQSEAFSWVFFTRPLEYSNENIAGQYLDEVQMAARNVERAEVMQSILMKTSLHYRNMPTVAVTYEAFKMGEVQRGQFREGQNEIFDAQCQLKSYIECAMHQSIRERISIIPYTIEMYFPCIVFRGRMYEARVKGDDVTLKDSKHLLLKMLYKSPYSIYERKQRKVNDLSTGLTVVCASERSEVEADRSIASARL